MSEPAPLLAPLKPVRIEARLWTLGGFVADRWRTLPDDVPLPIEGRAIISLNRWRAEQETLARLGVPLGLSAQPTDFLDAGMHAVTRFGVIALAFPKFTDGRAYSVARRWREAGFTGEIRATGDVLLDQVPLMLRAGFNAFEITDAATVRALAATPLPAISRIYQAGSIASPSAWHARHARD